MLFSRWLQENVWVWSTCEDWLFFKLHTNTQEVDASWILRHSSGLSTARTGLHFLNSSGYKKFLSSLLNFYRTCRSRHGSFFHWMIPNSFLKRGKPQQEQLETLWTECFQFCIIGQAARAVLWWRWIPSHTKGLLFFVQWLPSSEDVKGPTHKPSFLIKPTLPFFWQWDYLQ